MSLSHNCTRLFGRLFLQSSITTPEGYHRRKLVLLTVHLGLCVVERRSRCSHIFCLFHPLRAGRTCRPTFEAIQYGAAFVGVDDVSESSMAHLAAFSLVVQPGYSTHSLNAPFERCLSTPRLLSRHAEVKIFSLKTNILCMEDHSEALCSLHS